MKSIKNKLISTGILVSLTVGSMHIINKMIAASASILETPASTNHTYYDWRFGRIYYTKQGSGEPLLLIHDLLPGCSGFEWKKVEDELAKNYTVYTIDLLGCGRSDRPSITYTNFIYVQLIEDFTKNIIAEPTSIIASGFSGSMALMACHNNKELYNKIMLINPPTMNQLNKIPTKESKMLKVLFETPVLGTLVYNMIMSRPNVDNLFTEKVYYNPFHIDKSMLDSYFESAHRKNSSGRFLYASIAGNYMNLNISHAIKDIDHSIYIVEGSEEKSGKEVINDYTTLNPAIETITISQSRHVPHIEQPNEFMKQTRIFFNH